MSKPSLRRPRRGPSGSSSSSSPSIRKSAKKAKVMQAIRTAFDDEEVPSIISDAFSGKATDHEDVPSKDHPPSDFAWRKVWKMYQFQRTPRFLGYRGPVSARPQISLVLVHESFSKFAIDLENEKLELSEGDYEMAEDVYMLFTEGFDDEVREMNQGKVSKSFQSYLDAPAFTGMEYIKMDGYMNVTRRPQTHLIFIVFEDKTDDGPNGYFEALEICRRLFMLESTRLSHGILVLRTCPYITFIALVMDREANVLLSEPLAHIPFWGPQYQTVLQGAKAMRALRNFSDSYISQWDIGVSLPWPIAAWQNVKPLSKDGLVLCGTSESKRMVAKFTQHYSHEAHEAWHRKNLAPKLYGSKGLGAGWKFVTMEYLSEDAGWRSVAKVPPDDKLQQLLIEFLKKGHETDYVHGDFRPPNLLINGAGAIQAINFEWSGREGVARYPVKLNAELQWEPTARRGEVLKNIHDLWHVNKIGVDPGASTSRVA